MHFEIWHTDPNEVWADMLYTTEDEEEARHAFFEARAQYEDPDTVDCFKVDENNTLYAMEFI